MDIQDNQNDSLALSWVSAAMSRIYCFISDAMAVQAEYLKEVESRAEAFFKQLQPQQSSSR